MKKIKALHLAQQYYIGAGVTLTNRLTSEDFDIHKSEENFHVTNKKSSIKYLIPISLVIVEMV